jgi:NitT/TauT family transport system permease protein
MTTSREPATAPGGWRPQEALAALGSFVDRGSPYILAIAVVVGWWLATNALERPRIYPGPAEVIAYLGRVVGGETGLGPAPGHVAATLMRLLAAWSGSMIVGTLIGVMAGRSATLYAFFENLVWIFLATPSVVWVFIFAVAIGLSDLVPVLAISALLVPQVLIVVAEGARAMPSELGDLVRAFRVRRWQRLVDVELPYLLPYVVSSARNTFALAIKLILVAEVVGLARGIGYVVKFWRDQTWFAPVLAWGILLAILGIAIDNLVFGRLQRRVAAWAGQDEARVQAT